MSKLQSHLEDTRQRAEKSDLDNLASAIYYIEQEELRLADLKRRIHELAEAEHRPEGAVRRLYDEARGGGR